MLKFTYVKAQTIRNLLIKVLFYNIQHFYLLQRLSIQVFFLSSINAFLKILFFGIVEYFNRSNNIVLIIIMIYFSVRGHEKFFYTFS